MLWQYDALNYWKIKETSNQVNKSLPINRSKIRKMAYQPISVLKPAKILINMKKKFTLD